MRIKTIGSESKAALFECMQRVFPSPEGETLLNALGVTKPALAPFSRMVCAKAIRDNLSFSAVDRQGQMVGFCVNEDLASAPSYAKEGIPAVLLPKFQLLEELRSVVGTPLAPFEVFHMAFFGVVAERANTGIAKRLVQQSLKLAMEFRFGRVQAEATGERAQTLLLGLGFKVIRTMRYQDFATDDAKPFASVQNPSACLLLEYPLAD